MDIKDKIINRINIYAQSYSIKKTFLTIITGIFFISITTAFVLIPLYIDRAFNFPIIPFPLLNFIISIPFIIGGMLMTIWCIFLFLKKRGTPVPLNPPSKLIVTGPYKFSRNPMTLGLFLQMFGIGIYFGSLLSVLIFTPLFILIHYYELKNIEEPELEKRLGKDYIEYKKRVPMFFPKI